MFEELEKGVSLRDLVVEILREGPRSISQVGRALKDRGLKLHRLAVAGYLKGLADLGLLDEREIPPAKVYSIRPGQARRDVHALVAQRCREQPGTEQDAARLYLQVLAELFRRPIFREELLRVGLDPPKLVVLVEGEDRQAARRHLGKTPLKLPFNDPAYRVSYRDAQDEATVREASRNLVAALLREELNATALAMTSKQVTLGGVE